MKCEKCGAECNIVSILDKRHMCTCDMTSFNNQLPNSVIDEIQSILPQGIIVEVEDSTTFKFTNVEKKIETLVAIDEVDMFLHYLDQCVVND